MKVGILTGGGDCPGLNAVIRATAKSLLRHGRAEVIGIADGGRGAQVDTRVGAELGRMLSRILGRILG